MKIGPTYYANLYVGTRVSYTDDVLATEHARKVCQDYCNQVGLGLSFTQTEFIYVHGKEPGIIVGLINYPRFPTSTAGIKLHALSLGKQLLEVMKQERLSIVFPEETIMLESKDSVENINCTDL